MSLGAIKPYKTVYDLFESWEKCCLKNDGALLFAGENLWTAENLAIVIKEILGDEALREQSLPFGQKLELQFSGYGKEHKIWLLLCELSALHNCIKAAKTGRHQCFADTISGRSDYDQLSERAGKLIKDTDGIIGFTGNYDRRRWLGMSYFASLALNYKRDDEFKNFIDHLKKGVPDWENEEMQLQGGNIIDSQYIFGSTDLYTNLILHLFRPNYHTYIAIKNDRRLFLQCFSGYLTDGQASKTENEKIYLISEAFVKRNLKGKIPADFRRKCRGSDLVNFYSDGLVALWKRPLSNQEKIHAAKIPTTQKIRKWGKRQVKYVVGSDIGVRYQTRPGISKWVLTNVGYKCQFDYTHKTFMSKVSRKNFVEAHHLIPISKADTEKFCGKQIDCTANIVALCPNCHRAVHLGDEAERKERLSVLYEKKKDELKSAGLDITFAGLLALYK